MNANDIVIKRVSNYGTSHPVFARLIVQSNELLQWCDLPKDKRDAVFTIHNRLKVRLLKCHEVHARLIEAAKKTLEEVRLNSDKSTKMHPFLIGLENESETFLYDAKGYFRDLLGVVNVFFATSFDKASDFSEPSGKVDGKLTKWANSRFGPTDPFTDMFRNEQHWIGELVSKRNAVEHPGGYSGRLIIENFGREGDRQFIPPCWHRENLPATSLLNDIEAEMDDMLTLAEDVLVACISKTAKTFLVGFLEFVAIPEKDRSPQCPIRIRVQRRE